eukprot:g6274.t1
MDTNSDDRVSYTEFIRWLFHGSSEATVITKKVFGENPMDCFPNCLRACASLGYDVDDEMLKEVFDLIDAAWHVQEV